MSCPEAAAPHWRAREFVLLMGSACIGFSTSVSPEPFHSIDKDWHS